MATFLLTKTPCKNDGRSLILFLGCGAGRTLTRYRELKARGEVDGVDGNGSSDESQFRSVSYCGEVGFLFGGPVVLKRDPQYRY